MYYVADADGDNDTNCRSRSRSQQHTGMTCYDEARRCPTALMSRSRLSAECIVVVALWGDIYIKAHVEQHLGNRNVSEFSKVNLNQIKASTSTRPDQPGYITNQTTYHRLYLKTRPERKIFFKLHSEHG